MSVNDGPRSNAECRGRRHSGVARFIDALETRLRGTPASTALPEQLESIVRQVESDVAAGASPVDERLTAHFTRAATSVGMDVHLATSADWLDPIVRLLQMRRVESATIPPAGDGFFAMERVEQLKTRLAAEGVAAKSESDDETLFSVGAAITGVAVAMAEAGTLVCESGAIAARGSSLIPPVHIAVVGTTQILPDLYDYLHALGARPQLPANVSLITGPSKTADIEGVLVTGVHGPEEVHVVLVREG